MTTPVEPATANDGALLVQVPPGVASDMVILDPAHTLPDPIIVAVAVTASASVTVQPETV